MTEHNKLEYPAELEAWWVAEAEQVTGLKGEKALGALTPEVEGMSLRFTRERPEMLGGYTETEAGCTGYGVYFFPQTFARMWHVLKNLEHREFEDLEILDVGSGTGAAGLAVARWGTCHGTRVKVTAVEKSALAMETGRRVFAGCRELWPEAEWEGIWGDLDSGVPVGRRWDVVVCSFVLNELGDEEKRLAAVRRMLGWLKPGGVVMVLEPAGEASSGALMRMRDVLVSAISHQPPAIRVLAPCLHQAACPMRVAGHGYCHDVRRWRVPGSLEFVNRKLQRTIWDVKVSYLILQDTGQGTENSEVFSALGPQPLAIRVVAPVTRTKAHVVTKGCCADGMLREFELQCREVTKAELRQFDEWERGDLGRVKIEKLLGDGRTWRVKRMERGE